MTAAPVRDDVALLAKMLTPPGYNTEPHHHLLAKDAMATVRARAKKLWEKPELITSFTWAPTALGTDAACARLPVGVSGPV